MHVWGTRASEDDYDAADGSDLSGLHYSCVDVSDHAAIEAHQADFDTLDVLVLSQGVVRYRQEEFEKPGWDYVMDVNIDSVMSCASKFKPLLAETNGAIIIVSSISGMQANIGNPAYAASKAAAISLTKTLGQAWARDGIRVNGLAPGLVPTKLTAVTTENENVCKAHCAPFRCAAPVHRRIWQGLCCFSLRRWLPMCKAKPLSPMAVYRSSSTLPPSLYLRSKRPAALYRHRKGQHIARQSIADIWPDRGTGFVDRDVRLLRH